MEAGLLHSQDGIRRGARVQIVGGHPGFQVSIAGTALQDGGRDEYVQVRNNSTGRIVNAHVTGSGTVQTAASPR